MCFPRPCRFVARRFVFACQFAIGEALAADLGHGKRKALAVIHVFAIVETEHLFVKVTEKMKRFHANVGSVNSALQQTPEVLQAVGVNLSVYVLLGMVDHLLGEICVQAIVGL